LAADAKIRKFMEISRRQQDGYLELLFEGRLDGYWAQHLTTSASEVLQEGTHAVRLNLARATYISSAGIGVLVSLYQQFRAVNGSFGVVEAPPSIARVLNMVGVGEFLTGAKPMAAGGAAPAVEPSIERREVGGAAFEIHTLRESAYLVCRVWGSVQPLAGAGFSAADCREMAIAENRMALGLGAFGEGFDACRDRFGEFLAVSGASACQPTDGTNFPDYMSASGSFVPRVLALYGISCDGALSRLVRFESAAGTPLGLSAIVSACLDAARAETAGIVMLAESAGLLGASLKRTPVGGGQLFGFPPVRDWLSFAGERSYGRALALIVGVASRSAPEVLRPLVRPMGSNLSGHFHAAAFGYKPLPKGKLEMRTAVRGVFDAGGLQGVLHLLADDRAVGGAMESELLRGACWVGPIRETEAAQ
jgi:anti-anti-sigma factor